MRDQDGKSLRPLTRIAGVALVLSCAAGIALFIRWIPTSMGSPRAIVAPAELPSGLAQRSDVETSPGIRARQARCPDCGVIESTREVRRPTEANATDQCAVRGHSSAATTGGNQGAENADLAILLDWHIDAHYVYGALRHGIGCAPQTAAAAAHLVQAVKVYEVLVRFRDGSSQLLTEASLSTWRRGERVKVVTEQAD